MISDPLTVSAQPYENHNMQDIECRQILNVPPVHPPMRHRFPVFFFYNQIEFPNPIPRHQSHWLLILTSR